MQTFMKLKIILAPSYEDEHIKLTKTCSDLVLRLWGCYNEAVAEADVGIHKKTGERITVRMVFPYIVHALEEKIELCINSCNCELSPKMTILRKNKRIGLLHPYTETEAFLSGFGHELSLLQMKAFQGTLKNIHDIVYTQAVKQHMCISERANWGAYAERLVVIHKHQISHFFDPASNNDYGYDTVNLGSWLKNPNIVTFPSGTHFYNVRGSSKDPKIPKPKTNEDFSWIDLWQTLTNTSQLPPCCYHKPDDAISNGHICSATRPNEVLFGLHSVTDLPQRAAKPGEIGYDTTKTIYIVPGCQRANSVYSNSLVLQMATRVVAMDHYFQ